jgi:uncharacterized oxidoreductase
MQTSGHKVLITGGNTGLGFAMAAAFMQRDNQVMIAARRPDRLAEAAERLPGVATVRCDVAREDDLRSLVTAVTNTMGGVSVLVNNAGIQCNDDYALGESDTILSHVDQEVGINFTGLVKLTVLCMPLLRRQPGAAVVNVSSLLAIAPKQSAPVYCATKSAVRFFSKALRWQLEDWAPSVRVFEVLPPLLDTEMTAARQGKKMPPSVVADALLAAMEGDRFEVLVGATKKLVRAHRIHPRLAEGMVRRR